MNDDDLYVEREQTLIKHFILRSYLERFAHIVGTFWNAITYVDCFAGPWNVRSEEFKDSSFAIALDELRKARATHATRGRTLRLRGFFLEKDPRAYSKLKQYADGVTDAEIETRNCDLEGAIDDILSFVHRGEQKSFPFILIDPTGWTGFGMNTIAPLLKLNPGEVLINFMTGHIQRFVDAPSEQTQESFVDLFGSASFKEKLEGLTRQDREDALVAAYAENVRATGKFAYSCTAIVLRRDKDRTHFHLIYATRDAKGVQVFKEIEKKAMSLMEKARADVQHRARVKKTGAQELFPSDVLYNSTLYEKLRERYLARAYAQVQTKIQANGRLSYDEAWICSLSIPLVWESDLKQWITEWIQKGHMRIDGMKRGQRVPKGGEQNVLVWVSQTESAV